MSWAGFEADAPGLAALVRGLLRRDGIDQAFLATVRGDEAPRIHPVYVGIVDGRLYTFASGVKRADLEHDGRYALHPHQDPDLRQPPSNVTLRVRGSNVVGRLNPAFTEGNADSRGVCRASRRVNVAQVE